MAYWRYNRWQHIRRFGWPFFLLAMVLYVGLFPRSVFAEDNEQGPSFNQTGRPFLLVCIQPDFAIRLKPSSVETCNWVVVAEEHGVSAWGQFLSKESLSKAQPITRSALYDDWQEPTAEENRKALPIPAQMLLDFQMLEEEALYFYQDSRTSLNWLFRRQTGMMAPHFASNYMDNPLRRVGLRLRLDY